MRRRSSLIAAGPKRFSTVGASVHSLWSNRPNSGANTRAVRSRLRASRAQCFAVVMSHAAGFSGIPRNLQTSTARQNASCTTSSTSGRLWTPKTRVSTATIRPYSRRKRCSRSSIYVFRTWIGRTSTEPPTSSMGQPLEISTACARSFASTTM